MYPYGDTRTQAGPAPTFHEGDDRAARRTLWFLAVAVFVAVLGATLVVSLATLGDSERAPVATRPAPAETVTTLPPVTEVGPRPGVDLVSYVASRKAALTLVRDERVAVISLTRYLTQVQAKALLGTTPAVALLVAPPGIGPAVVPGDLAAWLRAQTLASTTERDEIKKLIPTVADAGFKAFYTAEVARLDKALKGFAPDSALVFGVVVRGPAKALQALAARPEVRLVDVGESSARPGADTVYRGLRPEEIARAEDPPFRPV